MAKKLKAESDMTIHSRLEELERACGQTVAIEHDESLAGCNAQFQSPLFSKLPREIRELIWTFATAPVEDESHRYKANEYYCRPGHLARHKTYTDLLYTCRRVWLEANALPMLQAEHCFWYYRAAPDQRDPAWMAGLTKMNRRNFGHLHLFAQMYTIESLEDGKGRVRDYFLKTPELAGDFQPRMLHVTIRHTDWWNWESEAPLRLEDSWFKAMLDSPDLRSTQTLKLELETLNYKVDQLMPIVERLKRLESKEYHTHVVDGEPTPTKFVLTGEPEVNKWTGPADINGHRFGPYEGKTALNYHVVTLTWRLRFLEIPRAHVPELRRAPRVGAPESPVTTPKTGIPKDQLPKRPRAELFLTKPSTSKSRRRRRLTAWRSTKKEERANLFPALDNQRYLWTVQKWQDDVRRAVEVDRVLVGLVKARWAVAGSLLKWE